MIETVAPLLRSPKAWQVPNPLSRSASAATSHVEHHAADPSKQGLGGALKVIHLSFSPHLSSLRPNFHALNIKET